MNFATVLREENGVDVVLDKWDLKEGHDAIAFMERMVTDKEIEKVVLLVDPAYVEKCNSRAGGVGTEAQVVSPELYSKAEQDKFVAVIMERNVNGDLVLPAYYRSRIYIDLSDHATYSREFDRLLRWIYNKPVNVRPDIGRPPAFLTDDGRALRLGTSSRFRRAADAIHAGAGTADGDVSEYLDCFAEEMAKLRIDDLPSGDFDDAVMVVIESFRPYRDEFLSMVEMLARYRDTEQSRRFIQRFFGQIMRHLDPPVDHKSRHSWSCDAVRFAVYELLLYTVAVQIRHERFESVGHLLEGEYYRDDGYSRKVESVGFQIFRQSIESLEHKNSKLEQRKLSPTADLIMKRAKRQSLRPRELIQADFVMYLRDQIHRRDDYLVWNPITMLYAQDQVGPFEVFARARSTAYFNRLGPAIGISSLNDLQELITRLENPGFRRMQWQHVSLNPLAFMGHRELCSRP